MRRRGCEPHSYVKQINTYYYQTIMLWFKFRYINAFYRHIYKDNLGVPLVLFKTMASKSEYSLST